jgi:hypothetical protein
MNTDVTVHVRSGDSIDCQAISPRKRYCLTLGERLMIFADADKMLEIFNTIGNRLLLSPDGSTDRADIAPAPAEVIATPFPVCSNCGGTMRDVGNGNYSVSYRCLACGNYVPTRPVPAEAATDWLAGDAAARRREPKIRDNVIHNVPMTIDVPDLMISMSESFTLEHSLTDSHGNVLESSSESFVMPDGVAESYEVGRKEV